ncbi:MAG: leucine-rich repeat domain-containing protein [Ruminococcus sp.]|nr:leucine-rich repeat domain-containing protein [Ruminococcus sp.]
MINKRVIISLVVTLAMISSNFNTIWAGAFAGVDDYNYGYNDYSDNYSYGANDSDGYGDYIYGIDIDENASVEIVSDDDVFTDLTYVIENNQVTITGYDKTVNFSYYTMPSVINGYPVTAISENAFQNCSSLISIVIPSTVKTVGEYAFSNCKNLQSVTFQDVTSTTDIEDENLYGDTYDYYGNLVTTDATTSDEDSYSYNGYSFDYSEDANNSYDYNSYYSTTYDTTASYDYYGYTTTEDVTTYEDDTYNYDYDSYYSTTYDDEEEEEENTDIEETIAEDDDEEEEENIAINPVSVYVSTLKEGVTAEYTGISAIMEHAFSGCKSLETLSVPSTLSFMGAYAIEDTAYYNTCKESSENIIIGSVYYRYFPTYKYSYVYNDETSLYEPVVNSFDEEIPEGIVSISYSAFQDVEGLTNLTMPESLKTIYDSAFANCTSLTNISFYDGIQYVGNNAFSNTIWLDESTNGFAIAGDYLYKYVGVGGSITIPYNVNIIGSEAFALNTNITRVVIQNGVSKIMGGAFYRCENLQTVVISSTVMSIGNQGFYGCKNLANITFNEGLLSVGSKCFLSCSNLKYAILPTSLTQIGDMAFGFDYNDIYSTYSMVDGFTLVGDEDSTAQEYATAKMINFQTKDDFVVPAVSKEYAVVNDDIDDEEVAQQPVDKKIIFGTIGGLVILLTILSLILYLKDRKNNPQKYKRKKKKKKKNSKTKKHRR